MLEAVTIITGGGPPPEPLDERLSQVEAAVPHIAVRVRNPYDSDRPLSPPATASVADIIGRMSGDNVDNESDDGQ